MLMLLPLAAVVGSNIDHAAEPEAVFPVPQFRHIDPTRSEPSVRDIALVRFVADEFLPAFQLSRRRWGADRAQCGGGRCNLPRAQVEMRVRGEALGGGGRRGGEGRGRCHAVGLKISPAALERFDFTAPFLRTVGRFAVRIQNQMPSSDVKSLAGKRIGVIAGSAHEAWVKAYYPRSLLKSYQTEEQAGEGLRTGAVDALFGDAYRLIFWIHGQGARHCCRLLPGAFVEPGYFSGGISIAVRRGNRRLLDALDYGLDRLQTSGEFARIYRKFFPEPPA